MLVFIVAFCSFMVSCETWWVAVGNGRGQCLQCRGWEKFTSTVSYAEQL